jgi:lysozyme family protein
MTLSPEEAKKRARQVQTMLNEVLGVELAVDGIIGEQTTNAIKELQSRRHLTVNGIYDVDTEQALQCAHDKVHRQSFTKHTADNVAEVQRLLSAVLKIELAVDGIWGKKTRHALTMFQTYSGIKADGIYGKETERALKRCFQKLHENLKGQRLQRARLHEVMKMPSYATWINAHGLDDNFFSAAKFLKHLNETSAQAIPPEPTSELPVKELKELIAAVITKLPKNMTVDKLRTKKIMSLINDLADGKITSEQYIAELLKNVGVPLSPTTTTVNPNTTTLPPDGTQVFCRTLSDVHANWDSVVATTSITPKILYNFLMSGGYGKDMSTVVTKSLVYARRTLPDTPLAHSVNFSPDGLGATIIPNLTDDSDWFKIEDQRTTINEIMTKVAGRRYVLVCLREDDYRKIAELVK